MRPTRDETMLNACLVFGERSTCSRRQVGAVLTDDHGRVLSTGHNGVAMGTPHCTDSPCPGSGLPSGQGLDACQAIHAEQNALLFCNDIMKINTCYVTASPCITCIKLLMNTGCKRVVFLEQYPHSQAAEQLWLASSPDRAWKYLPKDMKGNYEKTNNGRTTRISVQASSIVDTTNLIAGPDEDAPRIV